MSTTRYYPEPDNAAVRSAIPSEKAHPTVLPCPATAMGPVTTNPRPSPHQAFNRLSGVQDPGASPAFISGFCVFLLQRKTFGVSLPPSFDGYPTRRLVTGNGSLLGAVIALVTFDHDLAVSKDLRDDRLSLHDTPFTRLVVHHLSQCQADHRVGGSLHHLLPSRPGPLVRPSTRWTGRRGLIGAWRRPN